MSKSSLYRIGGVAAILGGAITQVSGALHPVETLTLLDAPVHMKEIADNPLWSPIFLGFSIGFLFMLVGLTALTRAIEEEEGSAWARVARQVATATTAVALLFFIVDGFAAKTIALAVVASHDNEAVVAAAAAWDRFGRMFFGQWTFLSWGVTPLLIGITVATSSVFKRWLGLIPIASGLVGIGAGVVHDLRDFSLSVLPPFYIAVLLFNVWLVAMGVLLVRGASKVGAVSHREPLASVAA